MLVAKAEGLNNAEAGRSPQSGLALLLRDPADHYRTLGVPPDSSLEQIKAAYRRRALHLHPDKNPGDEASEDAFKRCSDAYGVLSDPQRRMEYDLQLLLKGGPVEIVSGVLNNLTKGRFRRKVKGRSLHHTLRLTFLEVAQGGEHLLAFTVDELCEGCGGRGALPGGLRACTRCGGRGELVRESLLSLPKACPACGGTGKRVQNPCRSCDGVGMQEREREYRVTLPPGVNAGTLKVLRGQGEPGMYGGDAGDLEIVVEIVPHPMFTRDGLHALIEVPIGVGLASLGGSVDVPTLEGEVQMRVPAGTQSGRRFRVPGRGLGFGGDLIVRIVVETPVALDREAQGLLERFERKLSDASYPQTAAYGEQRNALAESADE
ncbi:MAG: J domain-containing protein [Deltaproteobacteria bacterium]|nr:J domain-containing protein [Deltaproteobacteria bacterium]